MPGPITYAMVMMLARDRLGQIGNQLRAKIATALPADVNDLERHVLYLADKAHQLLTVTPPSVTAPARLYGPALGDGVSKFALMGAVGPDLPYYSALFAKGNRWLGDTMHKGTADENRERVLTSSTDFLIELWSRVAPMIRAQITNDDPKRDGELAKMRAYVLGHACHVAADVVSHPFVTEVESHLGTATQGPLTRQQVVGAIETQVATTLLQRGTATRGGEWASWWPPSGDVPPQFYDAYAATLEHLYGPGARGNKGFGAFEKQLADDDPPPLSAGLLKSGYSTFRTVVDTGTAWDFYDWMLATFWMFLPSLAALPLAYLMPQGRLHYFSDADIERLKREEKIAADVVVNRDQGSYEVVVFPFAVTAILPLITTFVTTLSYLRTNSALVVNWASAVLSLAAAIVFFSTLGGSDWPRWVFLFIVPLVIEAVATVWALAQDSGDPHQHLLVLGPLLHLVMGGIFLGLYHAFLHKGVNAIVDRDGWAFLGWFGLWLLIAGACWIGTTLLMRFVFGSSLPSDSAQAFVTDRGHFVQLFDDTSLFRNQPVATSPTLADLFYPAGRRPILKLWWEGDTNPPTIRVDRDRLVFRHPAPTGDQTVFAPIAPMKPSELGALLTRVVKDSAGGTTSRLKTELVFPDSLDREVKEDYELPPGEIFSDHGDDQTTVANHDANAALFRPIPTDKDHPYVLVHAPKARQAVRYGRRGPVTDEDRTANDTTPTGGLTTQANPRQVRRTAGADSLFAIFRPGDIVQTTGGGAGTGQQRVVVSVDADDLMTLSCPFPVPLTGGAANTTYQRLGNDNRTTPAAAAAGTITLGPGAADVTGAGTTFGRIFRPGDTIRMGAAGVIAPGPVPAQQISAGWVQERTVVSVLNDTQLTVDSPFVAFPPAPAVAPPPPPPPISFVRVGDEEADGLRYMSAVAPGDDTIYTGDTVLNHAADLATLLCLGAASQVLDDGDLLAGKVPGSPNSVNRVYQVFRNWNLDRRRENEWKMLIAGSAISEKRGDATALDPAMPPLPAAGGPGGWTLRTGRGEAPSNRMGWVPAMRSWLDMARRPSTNTKSKSAFKPGDPPNLDLSRALAYLLDMRDPDPAP